MLHNDYFQDAATTLHTEREVARFAEHTRQWHTQAATPNDYNSILRLHHANFELWHLEDSARDPHATDAQIAAVKRAIDTTNQRRNDLVERIDTDLLLWLAAGALPRPGAPLHSETPGLILDRLSILSLKCFHTAEEIARPDADAAHIERNKERLETLEEQSSDLAECLATLWQQVCSGERRFKRYKQLKMYNDPTLNPVLYTK